MAGNKLKPELHQDTFTKCNECMAKMPTVDFSISRHSRTGRKYYCRFCASQKSRLIRKANGAQSSHDDSIIRSVRTQNSRILSEAMHNQPYRMYGFIPNTDTVFQIDVALGSSYDNVYTLDIQTLEGLLFKSISYQTELDQEKVLELLMNILKQDDVRLERTLEDVDLVKQTIYFY